MKGLNDLLKQAQQLLEILLDDRARELRSALATLSPQGRAARALLPILRARCPR